MTDFTGLKAIAELGSLIVMAGVFISGAVILFRRFLKMTDAMILRLTNHMKHDEDSLNKQIKVYERFTTCLEMHENNCSECRQGIKELREQTQRLS